MFVGKEILETREIIFSSKSNRRRLYEVGKEMIFLEPRRVLESLK